MNRARVVSGALLVALLSIAVAPTHDASAAGDGAGSGELRGGRLGVGIEIEDDPHPVPIDARSTRLPALVHYVSTPVAGGQPGDLEGLCTVSGSVGNAAQPVVFGWLYEVVAYTIDGRVLSDTLECVAFADPNVRLIAPPPARPAPPTIGDVWRAIALPRPIVGANPVSRGVTGLETRMWSGGAQTAQVAVAIGGYRITGTARVVEYRFSTDEGYVGAAVSPGDASNPAAVHRFVFKGAHSLSVASVWRATVTLVGPDGAASIPIDIDTAVLTATVDYPVVEVRSRLVG